MRTERIDIAVQVHTEIAVTYSTKNFTAVKGTYAVTDTQSKYDTQNDMQPWHHPTFCNNKIFHCKGKHNRKSKWQKIWMNCNGKNVDYVKRYIAFYALSAVFKVVIKCRQYKKMCGECTVTECTFNHNRCKAEK